MSSSVSRAPAPPSAPARPPVPWTPPYGVAPQMQARLRAARADAERAAEGRAGGPDPLGRPLATLAAIPDLVQLVETATPAALLGLVRADLVLYRYDGALTSDQAMVRPLVAAVQRRVAAHAARMRGRWDSLADAITTAAPAYTRQTLLPLEGYQFELNAWVWAHVRARQVDELWAQLGAAPWVSPQFWALVVRVLPQSVINTLDADRARVLLVGLGHPEGVAVWRRLAGRRLTPEARQHLAAAAWQVARAHLATARADGTVRPATPGAGPDRLTEGQPWSGAQDMLNGMSALTAWQTPALAQGFWQLLDATFPAPEAAASAAVEGQAADAGAGPGPAEDAGDPIDGGALPPPVHPERRAEARETILRLARNWEATDDPFWDRLVPRLLEGQDPTILSDLAHCDRLPERWALELLKGRSSSRVRTALARHATLGTRPAVRAALLAQGRARDVWYELARTSTDAAELSALLCYLAPLAPDYVSARLRTAPAGTALPASALAAVLSGARDRSLRAEVLARVGGGEVSRDPAPELPARLSGRRAGAR